MPRVANVSIELAKSYPVKETPLDITDKVYAFSVHESLLTGDLTWSIEILAESINSEEELIFGGGNLSLRISQVQDNIEQSTGWRMITIREASLFYYGETPVIKIEGNGLSNLLKQKVRWRSFVRVPVESVFREIANRYGLTLKVSPTNRIGTWYQLGVDDWTFLNEVIKEVTASTGQRALWVRMHNNTINIQAIEYSNPVSRSFGIGSQDDRVEEIKFKFYGREIDYLGGSLLQVLGFDIKNKQSISVIPSPTVLPVLAGKMPRKYGSGSRREFSTLQSPIEVTSSAINKWTERTSRYFAFHANMVGDMSLQVGSIIDIKAVDSDGSTSSMNGKYPVYETLHQYETGKETGEGFVPPSMTTFIGGYRRTFHYGNDPAQGANFSRVISQDQYISDGGVIKEEPVELESEEL